MTIYTEIGGFLGPLMLVADGDVLTGLHFVNGRHTPGMRREWKRDPEAGVFAAVEAQLVEYATGERQEFDVPLRLDGTPFQRAVWEAIRTIPFGETISYGALAERAGAPRAVRAAGAATGRNPVAVIVPCHRVVGSDGRLTGFGGGLDRKRTLLELESRVRASQLLVLR
jgi:methylated-DNA-[protein]-cysteine S-methyltransferase